MANGFVCCLSHLLFQTSLRHCTSSLCLYSLPCLSSSSSLCIFTSFACLYFQLCPQVSTRVICLYRPSLLLNSAFIIVTLLCFLTPPHILPWSSCLHCLLKGHWPPLHLLHFPVFSYRNQTIILSKEWRLKPT